MAENAEDGLPALPGTRLGHTAGSRLSFGIFRRTPFGAAIRCFLAFC